MMIVCELNTINNSQLSCFCSLGLSVLHDSNKIGMLQHQDRAHTGLSQTERPCHSETLLCWTAQVLLGLFLSQREQSGTVKFHSLCMLEKIAQDIGFRFFPCSFSGSLKVPLSHWKHQSYLSCINGQLPKQVTAELHSLGLQTLVLTLSELPHFGIEALWAIQTI